MKIGFVDVDALHHIDAAGLDIFLKLHLMLAEKLFLFKGPDFRPVPGCPGILQRDKDFLGPGQEFVLAEQRIDGKDSVQDPLGVVCHHGNAPHIGRGPAAAFFLAEHCD